MDQQLKRRIDKFDNPEAVKFFFELLGDLINNASIDEYDERLTINVRNDYRKRISVSINSRLVLFMQKNVEFGLLLNKSYLDQLAHIPILKQEIFARQKPEACLLYLDFSVLKNNINLLMSLWLQSCVEYLPAQQKSQYRNHHIGELYNIAVNKDLLKEYFTTTLDRQTVNVKNPFVKWMISTDRRGRFYFSKQFNSNVAKFSKEIDEYEAVYRDAFNSELFVVDSSELEKKIKNIQENLYGKSQTFSEYNKNKANGRPSAILGRMNYLKFLREYFSGDNEDSVLENLIKIYVDACKNTSWFDDELYKFEWAQWLNERVDFNTQSDEQILALLIDSQKQRYHDSVGVQFIKQGARKELSKYIGIEDIRYYREFAEGKSILDISFTDRNTSFPILSCWLSVLFPEKIYPVSKTNFAEVARKLFDAKINNSGIDFILGLQPYFKTVDQELRNDGDYNELLQEKLKTDHTIQLDYNWAAQDFFLYLDRHRELLDNIELDDMKDHISPPENNDAPPLNQILYGPPGTGKTFATINTALEILGVNGKGMSRDDLKEIYNKKVEEGQIVFTTFHQSMSYEDFIEGIKPITIDNDVVYEVKDGIFKKICLKASEKEVKSNNFEQAYQLLLDDIDKAPDSRLVLETLIQSKEFSIYKNSKNNLRFHANTEKAYEGVIKKDIIEYYLKTGETLDWPSYVKTVGAFIKENYHYTQAEESIVRPVVLIIDEINRGNMSQIFGELITLIEEDKRLGKREELRVTLPYSQSEFGVPQNVYIVGTMNTADRSVEALDSALRRRFSFKEIMPDASLLANKQFDGFNLMDVLQTINNRIESLLDRDHTIGHSYFIKIESGDTKEFKKVFKNCIVPLLQEYFYGDYEKIALILGSGFVRLKETSAIKFATFKGIDTPDVHAQLELITDVPDIEGAILPLLNRNGQPEA